MRSGWLLNIFALIALTLTPSIQAQQAADAAVLPLFVAGSPPASFYSRAELPTLLQDAVHFLLQDRPGYTTLSTNQTAAALRESGFRVEEQLTSDRASSICRTARVRHLITGRVEFLPSGGGVAVELRSWSCGQRKLIANGSAIGTLDQLQRSLRDSLRRATPFALPPQRSHRTGQPFDLVALVDFSGSMAEELPVIERGLRALLPQLPAGSRFGLVAVTSRGHQLYSLEEVGAVLGERDADALSAFRRHHPSGEVDLAQLERALDALDQFRAWRSSSQLLLFSDAVTGSRAARNLETRLRRLQQRGVAPNLFMLSGQSPETRREIERLARALQLPDPVLSYGRRVGFVEGYSLFLIQHGNEWFRADRDLGHELVRGQLDPSRVASQITTARYRSSDLNMGNFPAAFARENRVTLFAAGPLLSSLERRMAELVLRQVERAPGRYRVLVASEGSAFWIGFDDRQLFDLLQGARSERRQLYLGLHLINTSDPIRPNHLNDPIYLLNQADAPRLLINRWSHITQLSENRLHADDLWFFLVEVRELNDTRERRDIRH